MKVLFMWMMFFVFVPVASAITTQPGVDPSDVDIRLDDVRSFILFPPVSVESANIIVTVLDDSDLTDYDYFSIQGCVTGMVHDIETILKADVNEVMIRNYILLCLVIDIRLMDETLEQLTEEK